jgi:hypothetical protein
MNEAFEAAGSAFRDDAVREHIRDVGRLLGEAWHPTVKGVVAVEPDEGLPAGVVVQQWRGGRVEDLTAVVDDGGGVVGTAGLAATGKEPMDQLVAGDLQVQGDAD